MVTDRLTTRVAALRRTFVVALLVWLVVGTVQVYPFYLPYFNELVGGPGNGYRYLTDSALDWGQDLKGLRTYLHRNGIAMVQLAYFGKIDPRAYGIVYERLVPGQPTTGYIAVSATKLMGLSSYPGDPDCVRAFEWLQRYQPIAKIGYSIFVYHISPTESLPPAISLPGC